MKKLLLGTLLLFAAPVGATVHTYDFEGDVVEPSWRVTLGEKIRGVLTLDDAAPADQDYSTEDRPAYLAATLSFTAAGRTFSHVGQQLWLVGQDTIGNLGTNFDDPGYTCFNLWLSVAATPPFGLVASSNLDQTWTGGGFGLEIDEDPTDETPLQNFSGRMSKLSRRQGEGQLVSADITPIGGDAAPVPEPASLVLLGSALAGLGGFRGIKRRLARRK